MKARNTCPVCGEEGKHFPVASMPYISDGNAYYCGRFSYITERNPQTDARYLVRTQFCDTWFPSVTQEAKWEKEKESERVRMGLESKDSFEEPFGDINMLNIDSEGFPVS